MPVPKGVGLAGGVTLEPPISAFSVKNTFGTVAATVGVLAGVREGPDVAVAWTDGWVGPAPEVALGAGVSVAAPSPGYSVAAPPLSAGTGVSVSAG